MIKKIINKLGIYKTYPLNLEGKKFKIPVYKGIGFTNLHDSEPWMTDLLRRLGSNDTIFLDVGVNTGQTLLKWKAMFPESSYTGIEPNTLCVDYVNNLIKVNHLSNCKIHPFGLSTSSGSKKLYLLGKDPADSSATTIENFREGEQRSEMKIETRTLREIDKRKFDLIKIDVEGAELEVIQSIFEEQKNAIITCEILPVYKPENIERLERQNQIEQILRENNYSIYRIIKNNIQLEHLESFDIHDSLDKSDYVFIPNGKVATIISKFN